MSIEGVDYSFSPPSVASLVAAGKKFAIRYGGPGTSGKWLKASEYAALTAAGIEVVANAEGGARGFTGWNAGVSWATSARDYFNGLGMPAGRPIYFSADWDVQSNEWAGVRSALQGAASVIGAANVGLYAGRRPIQWAKDDGVATWLWQTYAWSGGVWVPGTHLQQYHNGVSMGGGEVDLNRAMTDDYGQWGAASTQPSEGTLKINDGVQTGPLGKRIIKLVETYYPEVNQLYVTSAYRPDDSGSHHSGLSYNGSPTAAVDFGAYNDPEPNDKDQRDMGLFADWLFENFWDLTVELIHTQPHNDHYTYVKNQKKVGAYASADHVNHVHWATSAALMDQVEARARSKWGSGTTPPPVVPSDPNAYPLPAGHYFGDINGPAESHGGYYAAERPAIQRIQYRLQQLSFAPWSDGWADGIYGSATVNAVTAYQTAKGGLAVDGKVGPATWAALFAPVVTPPVVTPPVEPPVDPLVELKSKVRQLVAQIDLAIVKLSELADALDGLVD